MYRNRHSVYTFFTNCFVFVIPSAMKWSRGICLYYRYLVRQPCLPAGRWRICMTTYPLLVVGC